MTQSKIQNPKSNILAFFIALALTSPLLAAEVEVSVSQRETEVGLPVTLTIEIVNASKYEHPQLPPIDGAALREHGGMQESSFTTITNGQMTTRKSRRFTYQITPSQVGTLTIPPIAVIADGQTFTSQAIDIIVAKSDFSIDDVLFVEIQSQQQSIYLGQPLNATLRIWLRPYQNQEIGVRLAAEQMWSLVDFEASTWGDFREALLKSQDQFGRWLIGGDEVIREDREGNPRAYYVYDIPTMIWAQQAGALAIQPPHIIVNYPARLGRDVFRRLSITESRRISATATLPQVEVKTPPSEGQPPNFNGAVGRFDISVAAKPIEVAVGDPITLTISVFDRSNGQARLDLLPPPPLERVPELVQNFKIPSEPLAGTVNGNVKTFTQTLRARSANVTQIPAIALTFFDPATETYITRQSEAIPITVKPGSGLAAGDVVQSNGFAPQVPASELKTVAGGILANYADAQMMLANHEFRMGGVALGAIMAPPILFLLAWIGRLKVLHRVRNEASIRRRTARKRAAANLKAVRHAEAREQARTVLAALSQYVSDRLNIAGRTLASGEIVEILRRGTASNGQLADLERLIEDCDQHVYASGVSESAPADLASRALMCIDQLERSRLT